MVRGMQIGVDSYCFHRFFGEINSPMQDDPGIRMSVWDFLDFAAGLNLDGVSIETAFLPDHDETALRRIRDRLDELGLALVWAWGHPRGLRSGTDGEAADDLHRHIQIARFMGADVMRIVAGDRHTRIQDWSQHKQALLRQLSRLLPEAERQGVVLAVENHKDLLARELRDLITTVDSPFLGVCLDTGNNLRLFEDPVAVARQLAPWVRAVHMKDITVQPGNPHETRFWPTVPLGTGLVNITAILGMLADAGFSGLLAVETDYLHPRAPREHEAVRASVDYLRALRSGDPAPVVSPGPYPGVW